MSPKNVFQGITKRARLLLDRPEGTDVEFKRTINALDAGTLVAFANSPSGGAILVGVEEYTGSDGTQKGRPVGCDVDDEARLRIINKALDCVPSVPVWIVAENVRGRPFFRIEVRSSDMKPHATQKGSYRIREDGRSRALMPDDLLAILINREGEKFRNRFLEATHGFLNQLHGFQAQVDGQLAHMASTLSWAEDNTDDTKSIVDEVLDRTSHVLGRVEENRERIEALLSAGGVEDPVKARVSEELKESFKEELRRRPKVLKALAAGKEVSFTLTGDPSRLLSKEEAQQVALAAAEEVAEEIADATEEDEG